MSWDRKAGPGLVQKVGIAGRTVLVGVVIHFQHLKAEFNCCHLERRTKINLPKVSWLRRARPRARSHKVVDLGERAHFSLKSTLHNVAQRFEFPEIDSKEKWARSPKSTTLCERARGRARLSQLTWVTLLCVRATF